ncbi:amidohydrolase family protein [Embleya scabrispora]|uniref:amidohydrolase family protein n=1 Tax=Embleya scabrispora TaxID=159449 RepID=UPI00035CBEE3|nr:amidohydrolase family protein [Embleya scabrispora]MYS81883.1 amidohydrolase family protein [Streptomyces sp. SID5474]
MTPDPIVDAHQHVWDLSARDQPWLADAALAPIRRSFALTELEPEAASTKVTSTVLVQTIAVADETPEFLALAAASRLVAGVVGWVDLTAPDIAETIGALRELPGGEHLVGIRHPVQDEPDPHWLIRPDVIRGLAAVASAGLAYDLLVQSHQIPAAARAAATLPELTFVLDHLGKPPIAAGERAPWAGDIKTLAALPNTVCKLSGLVTEADWRTWSLRDLRPFAETALEEFGPDRLMFGSDWPVCLLAASYRDVVDTAATLTGSLSPTEQATVFAGTATRVYGLLPRGER